MSAEFDIGKQLQDLWDESDSRQQMHACLFTLVVWAGRRGDYFREVANHLLMLFPCRLLFLEEDIQDPHTLDVQVSAAHMTPSQNAAVCEEVRIRIGSAMFPRIPSLTIPNFVPDLPVYLVWGDDLSTHQDVFKSLSGYVSKLIFDSDEATSMQRFAQELLQLHMMGNAQVADLNWVRTDPWRELLAKITQDPRNLSILTNASTVRIHYNSCTGPFCHKTYAQALYLQGWLASELQWACGSYDAIEEHHRISCRSLLGECVFLLLPEERKGLPEGQVSGIHIESLAEGSHIQMSRREEAGFYVDVTIEYPECCQLPFHVGRSAFARGHSLAKELLSPGTNPHFIDILRWLSRIQLS